MSITQPEEKYMGYIKHLPLDAIEHLGQVNNRTLPPIEPASGNEPFQVDESIFDDDPCHCGYEEGRSEADKREHEQHCVADGDRAWDKFKDNATDEEMATFEREAFFASASDPASDESELVATAYRLGIGTKEFEAHREREGGAAREAF